jgi:L-cysteine S-thiosulfotransferase
MDLRQSRFALAAVLGAAVLGLAPASAAPSAAQKLLNEHCQQCHQIKGITDYGNVGPSLLGLKARYPDRKDVVAIVADETKRNPLTVMPPFKRNLILTDKQIAVIVDYLYNQ